MLEGKVVIITGSGQGIGKHAARTFAEKKAKVVIAEFDQMMEIGQAVAGTPENVLAFLQSQLNVSAANYLVGQFAFGDLSLAESLRSVKLFTRRVMPALRATF